MELKPLRTQDWSNQIITLKKEIIVLREELSLGDKEGKELR
jgi:hypothetical protein